MKLVIKISIILFFSLIFNYNNVLAYNFKEDSGIQKIAGPAGYQEDVRSLDQIIISNISFVLGLVGVIFLILIIYGGIMWMTAAGKEETVTKAKNIISNSLIGLIVVMTAYAISFFILEFVLSSTWNERTEELL